MNQRLGVHPYGFALELRLFQHAGHGRWVLFRLLFFVDVQLKVVEGEVLNIFEH